MKRAYKIKWTPLVNGKATEEGRKYKVLLADGMLDVYKRLAAGVFAEAQQEGELHIASIGEAV